MNIQEQADNMKNLLKEKEFVTEDGEIIKLHENTIKELSKEIIRENALINSEHKKQSIEGIKIRKCTEEFENEIRERFGNFYFNFYKNIPPNLERQYKFRFIYLCTYLRYEDNRLAYKQENRLYKLIKDDTLMEFLKLSKTDYYRTKNALIEHNLIKIDKDKNIHINNNISFVGKVSEYNNQEYSRVFKETIQELYKKSLPREHKKLGLLIELLPFIHMQYNILCENPTCDLLEDIKPLSIRDVTSKFEFSNVTTLKKQLLNIRAKNKKAIMIFEDYDKQMIAVNPSVFYRGTKQEYLQYLIDLFNI